MISQNPTGQEIAERTTAADLRKSRRPTPRIENTTPGMIKAFAVTGA
jgi:hypothetical protein